MKNYQLIVISIYLIFLLSINSVSAIQENEYIIDDFTLKNDNIGWTSDTYILTPFGDKAQIELIYHYHVPQNLNYEGNFNSINQDGTIISEIDFYINDEKKNFSDFFLLEVNGEKSTIKSKTKFELSETSDLKLKFFIKATSNLYFIDQNKTTLKYKSDFNLEQQNLFFKYVFRIPTINAHNVQLYFQKSSIKQPDSESFPIPISKIYETDEYLEISYIFWNGELIDEIVTIPDDSEFLIKLKPNSTYIFDTIFSIKYETFRVEWLIAIMLSSLVAILAFIGGAIWGKEEKE